MAVFMPGGKQEEKLCAELRVQSKRWLSIEASLSITTVYMTRLAFMSVLFPTD